MAKTKISNYLGKLTGWNNTTVNIMGRDVVGIEEIEYNDSTKKENTYGAGGMPIGWTEGTLPPGSRLQDIAPFDINVQYVNPQTVIITMDIIHNAQFTGRTKSVKNNEGKMVHKHEMLISHITWGNV